MIANSKLTFSNNIMTHFFGKNGYFKCSGFDFCSVGLEIAISPLTSRGKIAMCEIQIPRSEIDNFIKELEKFK